MAKKSAIQKNLKRMKLVKRYAKKRAALKKIINNKGKKTLNKSKRSNIKYNDSKKLTGGAHFVSNQNATNHNLVNKMKPLLMDILENNAKFKELYKLVEKDETVIDLLFDIYKEKYNSWFKKIEWSSKYASESVTIKIMTTALHLINIDTIKEKIKKRKEEGNGPKR